MNIHGLTDENIWITNWYFAPVGFDNPTVTNLLKGLLEHELRLTLMLMVDNLGITKLGKKSKENLENPGIWVLIWEYSARAFEWIPNTIGLRWFKKMESCALDESSLSIGRVKPTIVMLRIFFYCYSSGFPFAECTAAGHHQWSSHPTQPPHHPSYSALVPCCSSPPHHLPPLPVRHLPRGHQGAQAPG